MKGASEIVLASCTDWYNMRTGQVEPISTSNRQEMEEAIRKMA